MITLQNDIPNLYYTPDDFPSVDSIMVFETSRTPKAHDFECWHDWVMSKGEIISEVMCDDGYVMLVRINYD